MPNFNRREIISSSAIGSAAVLAGAAIPRMAMAYSRDDDGPPRQVPFYRTTVGEAEITVVSDGQLTFPTDFLLPDVPAEEVRATLERAYRPTEMAHLPINAMIVDINGQRVLIDAGDGGKFQPSAGRLADNLHAAGIEPESIDLVVFTHLHPDHLWGVTDAENEALVFPNARMIAPRDDHAFWSTPDLPDQMPEGLIREITQATQAHLERIGERLETVETDVAPGISLIPTHGHSPGHAAVMIESAGETLLSVGDVLADPVLAFEEPGWHLGVDFDPEAGARTRAELLDRLAADRQRSFGFHLPWPGFGHVARDGERYRWHAETWAM